jgi:asparagine synthase (glutamine-hydrolysing)
MSRYINRELWETYKNTQDAPDKVTGQKASSLNYVLYKFMTGPRLKSLLRYEDRNSMRFSIEARTPFSDDIDLISTVFNIPSSYKIRKGWSKVLLRNSMKGIVPAPILLRKEKIGFTAPEYIWLKKLKNILLDYIDNNLDCFFNVHKLKKEWDNFLYLQPSIGITGLWRFINLAIWKKVFSL